MFKKMLGVLVGSVVGGLGLLALPAAALPVDLTALTTAVDFSMASAAILTVAGALILVYIAIKASMFVIGMVRRG